MTSVKRLNVDVWLGPRATAIKSLQAAIGANTLAVPSIGDIRGRDLVVIWIGSKEAVRCKRAASLSVRIKQEKMDT
ncbi:hypothetical protein [Anaerospora sp.]|jgi:hypothetical protein|uniref:hypothetical protein n=1 Tax=Anaerospora sp. TaxID=1960278 RepID=UPI00289A8B7F|nr:hypothetical protein [Anaerospora sp.]